MTIEPTRIYIALLALGGLFAILVLIRWSALKMTHADTALLALGGLIVAALTILGAAVYPPTSMIVLLVYGAAIGGIARLIADDRRLTAEHLADAFVLVTWLIGALVWFWREFARAVLLAVAAAIAKGKWINA